MIYWLLAWLRRARPYATPVLIAMALSGLLIWIATWRVEWGSSDFPSWLEALSTLAAFGAAGVAVYFAIQTQRLETKREQRIEQSLVRDQASRVAAWFDYVAIETMTDVRGGGALATSIRGAMMGRSRVAGVYLRNASDLPVSSRPDRFTCTRPQPEFQPPC